MKHAMSQRLLALALALCVCLLPALSLADTFLPDGDVTHADFTLGLNLHADAFPAGPAHVADWEAFLKKLDLHGSINTLGLFTPDSRVYLDAALRLNGRDQVPFVFDGYHSYRYLLSPALGNEVLFFQMHNFLEFMLKPYYYMGLPTQYLGLLMYPDAAYYLGDSYYTPVAEMIAAARENALNPDAAQAEETGDEEMAEPDDEDTAETVDAEAAEATDALTTTADAAATAAPADAAAAETATPAPTDTPVPAPTATPVPDGTLVYTIPYEDLYETCETLDLIVNDDTDLSRAYFFFTSLLTDIYASDMTLDTLGTLENVLDTLDPDQNGMTVTETENSMTCVIGETEVFTRKAVEGGNAFTFTCPTPDGYTVSFDFNWQPTQPLGATLAAKLSVMMGDEQAILLTADGTGLPREGDLTGKGNLTFTASGYVFTQTVPPIQFQFDWVRDAQTLPYTLDLTLDWIHPATEKAALTLNFHGMLSKADKSVFVEGKYPQNDFFNLNESFLNEYKERLMPTLALTFAPFVLDTPAGVVNDLYRFMKDNDILVSLVE